MKALLAKTSFNFLHKISSAKRIYLSFNEDEDTLLVRIVNDDSMATIKLDAVVAGSGALELYSVDDFIQAVKETKKFSDLIYLWTIRVRKDPPMDELMIRGYKGGWTYSVFGEEVEPFDLEKPNDKTFDLDAHLLIRAIEKVKHALPYSKKKEELKGIFLDPGERLSCAVGFDGNNLALYRELPSLPFPVFISRKVLTLLKYLLKNHYKVYLSSDEEFTHIHGKNWTISCKKRNPFDYQALMQKEFSSEVEINRKSLIEAIKRVTVSDKNQIILNFYENTLLLVRKEYPDVQKRIDIDYLGKPLTITLKAKQLLEPLKKIPTDKVTLKLNNNNILIQGWPSYSEYYSCMIQV